MRARARHTEPHKPLFANHPTHYNPPNPKTSRLPNPTGFSAGVARVVFLRGGGVDGGRDQRAAGDRMSGASVLCHFPGGLVGFASFWYVLCRFSWFWDGLASVCCRFRPILNLGLEVLSRCADTENMNGTRHTHGGGNMDTDCHYCETVVTDLASVLTGAPVCGGCESRGADARHLADVTANGSLEDLGAMVRAAQAARDAEARA